MTVSPTDKPAAWAVLERLKQGLAHVPALRLWDTGNVLIQAERRGRISSAVIRTFLGLLETLPISVDHPTTASAWHDTVALARGHGHQPSLRAQVLDQGDRRRRPDRCR